LCTVVPGTGHVVHALSTTLSTASALAGSGNGHETGVSKVTVRLSADEITVVCNCINEALDALTDGDFQLRVGADRQQARALLGRLNDRRTAARQAAAGV
jgi:hypothetical protein